MNILLVPLFIVLITSYTHKKQTLTHVSYQNPKELLHGSYQRFHTSKSTCNYNLTYLDEFVSKPDPTYKWEELPTVFHTELATIYFVNLTSQKWLNESIVDMTIWWHYITIIVPNKYTKPKNEMGVVFVQGKRNDHVPSLMDYELQGEIAIAIESEIIISTLWNVPNEPILYKKDDPTHHRRSEDALIAMSWYSFFNNVTMPDLLIELPMTKAVIRTMDALEEYLLKKFDYPVSQWIMGGESKRAWTGAWLATAYDTCHEKRIIANSPLVWPFINMHKQLHSWWRERGAWSFAFQDSCALNLTERIDDPPFYAMREIIDPYVYRERFQDLVLYQIISSCDEFFTPFDTRHYWDDMMFKEKKLLILDNAEHALFTNLEKLVPALSAFLRSILFEIERPSISWQIDREKGDIIMKASEVPSKVKVFFSRTCSSTRIDYRWITKLDPCPYILIQGFCIQPIMWTGLSPIVIDEYTYKAHYEPEGDKWSAYYIEVFFNSTMEVTKYPIVVSTEATYVPFEFPFEDCEGKGCKGYII